MCQCIHCPEAASGKVIAVVSEGTQSMAPSWAYYCIPISTGSRLHLEMFLENDQMRGDHDLGTYAHRGGCLRKGSVVCVSSRFTLKDLGTDEKSANNVLSYKC